MAAVAQRVEDITAPWLSEVLAATVRTVSISQIGAGQTGATYRLRVDAEHLPPTLIAKMHAGDEAARRRVSNGFRAEVGFYRDLATTVEIPLPKCWYSAIAEDALSFTLILEDLAPRQPGVQTNGCSERTARAACMNLAGLHAPRWNDPSLFEVPFLPRPDEARAAFLAQIGRDATDGFVARYANELDSVDVSVLRSSAEILEPWLMAGHRTLAPLHGDYRLDNLMFSPNADDTGDTGDNQVIAVDWQTLAVAPPLRDLAYFLGTSVDIAQRRKTEQDLVVAYHRELCRRGVVNYSAEECFEDYRLGLFQGPMITTIGAMYSTTERTIAADAMFLAMARRSCATLRDLDAFSSHQLHD